MNQVTFVDYQEPLSIKVGKWLLEKGYESASRTGLALDLLTASEISPNSLGVLKQDPTAQPHTWLFGLIKRPRRKNFLGVIWFKNTRQADEKNWVFEIRGREYAEQLRRLADEMGKTFEVKITLCLVQEQPAVETYLSDYEH